MKIDERIKDLEDQIKELRLKKLSFESLTPDKKVAEALHKLLCHSNHVDQCGWEYESWERYENGYTRKRYLELAKTLMHHAGKLAISDIKIIDLIEFIIDNRR